MSKKSPRITIILESCRGGDLPANYLGYFKCFNEGLFFEAHDVLEELWLTQRGGSNDGFYKGLIQFTGAFVHLQKDRLKPAVALLRLSQSYVGKYPAVYERLDIKSLLALADEWVTAIESAHYERNPLQKKPAPKLNLEVKDPELRG